MKEEFMKNEKEKLFKAKTSIDANTLTESF